MIIRGRVLIISEEPNNKKDILYNLRESLPNLLTTKTWGYVTHGTSIRVQFQHYPESKRQIK